MKIEIHTENNEVELLIYNGKEWVSLHYVADNEIELKEKMGKRLGYELFDLIMQIN